MKTYKIIFLIILFPLFFISCSDDDDDIKIEGIGTLTIDGTVYELSQGIIYNRERWEPTQGYNFDVDLVSSDFDIENMTGVGDAVALEMFSATTDDLGSGTYTFGANEQFQAGTFCGIIAIGIDAQTDESDIFFIITSGSCVVVRSGNTYEFTLNTEADQLSESFESVVASNVPISCYYKGTLDKRDFK